MGKKKIAIVTSTRGDYNYFRLILKRILDSKKLELLLFVTGIHLLKQFGKTIDTIQKDEIPITEIIEMYEENDNREEKLGKAVGKAIIDFTIVFNKFKPDLLLILGDRYEPLAAVIAASTLSIPIAHIHGGDNVYEGQVDEQIRHAITKLSHIHFPATPKSADTIKRMGEEEWRINCFGSPSIDHMYNEGFNIKDDQKKKIVCKKLGLKTTEIIVICLYHPYIIEYNKAGEQMEIILNILKEFNLQTVIIYPNNDLGCNLIIDQIEKNYNIINFKIFKNLEYNEYYNLMGSADLLIGNSSSGIIESSIFKLPVVNIGNRNKGRETAENVINVQSNFKEIRAAVQYALSEKFKKICDKVKNPYGNGTASKNIVDFLENLNIDKHLLIKKLTYDI